MAQQKANFLHAAGRVGGAAGTILVAGSGNWSVVRTAAGLYTITLNDPIDTLERTIFLQTKTTSVFANVLTAGDTDTVFTVQVENDASADTDSDFDFEVHRVAG